MKSIILLFAFLIPVISTLPLASFYYLTIGNSVVFRADFSLGKITQFVWDFGDGSPIFTTTERSVTYFYPYSTLWKVKLTVIDGTNKQDSSQQLVLSPYNYVPSCEFSVLSIKDSDIILEASKSQDHDGNIMEYSWNVNDGRGNISTNSSRFVYSYQKGGFYNLSLVVKDNSNSFSVNSCWKKVFVNRLPIATFQAIEPIANHEVALDASNSQDYDGNIKAFIWDFGDGQNTVQNRSFITHDYAKSEIYNVSLKVVDNLDNSSFVTSQNILVDIPPSPRFEVLLNYDDQLILTTQNQIWVDNNSHIVESQWDWNDGTPIEVVG